jgi:hypothetical protein
MKFKVEIYDVDGERFIEEIDSIWVNGLIFCSKKSAQKFLETPKNYMTLDKLTESSYECGYGTIYIINEIHD